MSNELLPLLDILAGPPNNADHEERFVAAVNGGGNGLLRHDPNPDPSPDPNLDPGLELNLDPGPHSLPQTNGAATAAYHRDAATAAASPTPVPTGLADGLGRVSATIETGGSI